MSSSSLVNRTDFTDAQINAFMFWTWLMERSPPVAAFMLAWKIEPAQVQGAVDTLLRIIDVNFSRSYVADGVKLTLIDPAFEDVFSTWEPAQAHDQLILHGYQVRPVEHDSVYEEDTWIRYTHARPPVGLTSVGYPKEIALELIEPPQIHVIRDVRAELLLDRPVLSMPDFVAALAKHELEADDDDADELESVADAPRSAATLRAHFIDGIVAAFDGPLSPESIDGRLRVILEEELPLAIGDLLAVRRYEGARLKVHPARAGFRAELDRLINEAEALSLAQGRFSTDDKAARAPSFDGMIPGSD